MLLDKMEKSYSTAIDHRLGGKKIILIQFLLLYQQADKTEDQNQKSCSSLRQWSDKDKEKYYFKVPPKYSGKFSSSFSKTLYITINL